MGGLRRRQRHLTTLHDEEPQKVQREEGAINGAAVAIAATILALDVAIPHRQERQQRPKTNRELSAEDAET